MMEGIELVRGSVGRLGASELLREELAEDCEKNLEDRQDK